MKSNRAQSDLKETTRHRLRVMAFVVCAVVFIGSVGYGLSIFFINAEAIATDASHPFVAALGEAESLHRMDGGSALPLLALVFMFLIAPGLFKALKDSRDNKVV